MSYITSDWITNDSRICKKFGMANFNVISQPLSGRDEENQKYLLRECMAVRPISETCKNTHVLV
jgi:hypothetical protein